MTRIKRRDKVCERSPHGRLSGSYLDQLHHPIQDHPQTTDLVITKAFGSILDSGLRAKTAERVASDLRLT
jgi:hypothetical protein